MGRVYKAYDVQLERIVALKIILLKHLRDPNARGEFKRRFFREARIGAKLQHHNVVAIYDLGEYKERPFMVMEYVRGATLDKYIDPINPPHPQTSLEILAQMASALDAAHDQGIVHRDIKPGNTMVNDQGKVKILDFGMARFSDSQMTKTGEFLGTPRYSSPEQVTGKEVDGRSDLFSLAVVAHELLTGRTPFPGDSISAILFKIANGEAEILPSGSEFHDDSKLRHVFESALAKDRDHRYQTGAAFIAALRDAIDNGPERTASMTLPPQPLSVPAGADDSSKTGNFWNQGDGLMGADSLDLDAYEEAQRREADSYAETRPLQVASADSYKETLDLPQDPIPDRPPIRKPEESERLSTTPEPSGPPSRPRKNPKLAVALAISLVLSLVLIVMIVRTLSSSADSTTRPTDLDPATSAEQPSTDQDQGSVEADTRAAQMRRDLDAALAREDLAAAQALHQQMLDAAMDTTTVDGQLANLEKVVTLRARFSRALSEKRADEAQSALAALKGYGVDVRKEELDLTDLLVDGAGAEAVPEATNSATPDAKAAGVGFADLHNEIDDDLRLGRISRGKSKLSRLKQLAGNREQRRIASRLEQIADYPNLRNSLNALKGATYNNEDLYTLRVDTLNLDRSALFDLATHYREGLNGKPKDDLLSLAALKLAADQGYPQACFFLGNFFFLGTLVTQDSPSALFWYQKAADAGLPLAQTQLGQLHYHGQAGLAQDSEKAYELFWEAAQQGYAPAQYWTGRFHETGIGRKASVEVASAWYNLAARQGHKEAQAAVDRIEKSKPNQDP